jgi:tyrosyl-tRNA synthetase
LLAKEVVTLVHGEAKASRAEIQTQLLFPTASSKIVKFSALVIRNTFMGDEQMIDVPREELVGNLVSKVMRRVGAVKTRSEAENIIKSGGVYYGQEGNRIQGGDVKVLVQQSWLLDGEILLLKIGKGKSIVIRAV